MKTNFKKTLSVLLAVLMLTSVFSVTAFAATYTSQILPGTAEGVTLKAGITEDMLTLTSTKQRDKLPNTAYFEREDYEQDGWTTNAGGAGTLLKFGSSQSFNKKKYYPHWKQVTFNFIFGVGTYYDKADPNNNNVVTMKTDGTAAQPIVLPGAMFTREGYVQTGWTTSKAGTGVKLAFGSTYSGSITKDVNLYPFWEIVKYDVSFEPGEFGEGEAQVFEVSFGKTIDAPGEIFTREGYAMIGWATTENATEVELELDATSPEIEADVIYYPVWLKSIFGISVSEDELSFGVKCTDYAAVDAKTITIVNEGNISIKYTLPTHAAYEISVVSGSLNLKPEESVVVSIKPLSGLAIDNYDAKLSFVCNRPAVSFDVDVAFKVVEHSFSTYKSCGDATYQADGHKEAVCLNGCGTTDKILDKDSMKVVKAEFNEAAGIADSYVHHRTVRFIAYGSGMDDTENFVKTRFRPKSWYVDDTYNGEFTDNQFENGYEVTYTHTTYGDYTLTINYVEEAKDEVTGEWVATGETDTKTYEYTVGPTEAEKEEMEEVTADSILNIILNVFKELLKMLGINLF